MNSGWDKEVDVLIVGSGAGALTAAVYCAKHNTDVLVIEKSDEFGGTSATSGGAIWVPNSYAAAAMGAQDSAEEAYGYIRQLSEPNVPDANIRAFVQSGPEMLKWLEANTPIRYVPSQYPDYHADLPGGKPGYRTHLPIELDGRQLGDDMLALRQTSPAANLFGKINWRFDETYTMLYRPKGWPLVLARMLFRYYSDIEQRLRSPKDRFLSLGTALVGGLRISLNALKAPLWLNTKLISLVNDNGRIVGAVVERMGTRMRIGAKRAVILATGGFERNAELRAKYLPTRKDSLRTGSQKNNTGDWLAITEAVGAKTMNLDSAWWAPLLYVPGDDRGRLMTFERALPGCIIVNQAGRRYMNEASSYHLAGRAMIENDKPEAGTTPSWFVFDSTFRARYPVGAVLPLVPDFLIRPAVRALLKKADTIEELAQAMGALPSNLVDTITRFNSGAKRGVDDEFQRGAATYDKMYGDPRVTPNPTLAPLEKAPFYAYPIYPGDIGTNGGLATDEKARVLDKADKPIAGLYAIGNTAASIMGKSYPGAGSTLGPAMTFGYIAARDLTGAND